MTFNWKRPKTHRRLNQLSYCACFVSTISYKSRTRQQRLSKQPAVAGLTANRGWPNSQRRLAKQPTEAGQTVFKNWRVRKQKLIIMQIIGGSVIKIADVKVPWRYYTFCLWWRIHKKKVFMLTKVFILKIHKLNILWSLIELTIANELSKVRRIRKCLFSSETFFH